MNGRQWERLRKPLALALLIAFFWLPLEPLGLGWIVVCAEILLGLLWVIDASLRALEEMPDEVMPDEVSSRGHSAPADATISPEERERFKDIVEHFNE